MAAVPPPVRGSVADMIDPGSAPPSYAGLATRTLAFAIDAAVINVVAWFVGVVCALALSLLSLPKEVLTVLAAVAAFVALLWTFSYFVFFWSGNGQTPGDRTDRDHGAQRHVAHSAYGAPGRAAARLVAAVGHTAVRRVPDDPVRRAAARAPRPARAHRGDLRTSGATPETGCPTGTGGARAGVTRSGVAGRPGRWLASASTRPTTTAAVGGVCAPVSSRRSFTRFRRCARRDLGLASGHEDT